MNSDPEVVSLAAEFLSHCTGQLFNTAVPLCTLDNDPELAEMVSIGRAIQWLEEAEWREWCQATRERTRFYGYA